MEVYRQYKMVGIARGNLNNVCGIIILSKTLFQIRHMQWVPSASLWKVNVVFICM